MAEIRIYLTGRIALEIDGRLVFDESKFRGRQSKLLFAYLVFNRNRVVSRDDLAHLLWPDRLPPGWDASLNALVSRIRSLLTESYPADDKWLIRTAGEYVIEMPPDTWIDVEVINSAVDDAEGAVRSNLQNAVWGPANVAATIARRPFLHGMEGEWIESTRDWLGRQHVRALECLASLWLVRGETGPAIEVLTQVIESDPYRETSYQMLMRAFTREGNRAQGVPVYNQLRDRLSEDLQVEPSPESQAAYRELTS
jgi:SARP family transcriptional regulator, regulator of embCAB operon